MPYTTNVAGTTITSAWGNANVRDQVVTPFASTSARDSAISSPVSGMIAPITGDGVITYYNGSVWVCTTPQGARVATSESTTSTSYTDLSTSGPAVTMVTGTSAKIDLTCDMYNTSSGAGAAMGVAVSSASTISAADTTAVVLQAAATGQSLQMGVSYVLTGLTAGSNVFTCKYKAITAGTAQFFNRSIIVTGLP